MRNYESLAAHILDIPLGKNFFRVIFWARKEKLFNFNNYHLLLFNSILIIIITYGSLGVSIFFNEKKIVVSRYYFRLVWFASNSSQFSNRVSNRKRIAVFSPLPLTITTKLRLDYFEFNWIIVSPFWPFHFCTIAQILDCKWSLWSFASRFT